MRDVASIGPDTCASRLVWGKGKEDSREAFEGLASPEAEAAEGLGFPVISSANRQYSALNRHGLQQSIEAADRSSMGALWSRSPIKHMNISDLCSARRTECVRYVGGSAYCAGQGVLQRVSLLSGASWASFYRKAPSIPTSRWYFPIRDLGRGQLDSRRRRRGTPSDGHPHQHWKIGLTLLSIPPAMVCSLTNTALLYTNPE